MPTGRPTGNGRSCRYCIVGLIRNIKDINILYDSCPQLSKMVEPDIHQCLLSDSNETILQKIEWPSVTEKEKLILCDSGEAWRLKSVDVDISIFDDSMKGGDVIWAQSGKLFVGI